MVNAFGMDKQLLMDRPKSTTSTELKECAWSIEEKVALTCRILFANGHDSGLAGQITAKVENNQNFYTQQLGLGFDEITPENLLLVDEDLVVLKGDGIPNPANRFHTWIYRKRPDINCIIHTHAIHLSALSMLEKPLNISHMDSCSLYEDIAFLAQWPGAPLGNEDGQIISEALGDKHALLLAHHGIVVACGSVEEACLLALQCERTARMQLLTEAVGTIKPIDPCLGRKAHSWLLQEKLVKAGFDYYARRTLNHLNEINR